MRSFLAPFCFAVFLRFRRGSIFCAAILQACFSFPQTGNTYSLSLEVVNDRARLSCRTDENSAWVLQTASSLTETWFPLNEFVMRDSIFETPITESRGFFRLQQLPTSGALSRIELANGGMVLNLPEGQHGPSQNPYVSPKIPAFPKVVAGNTDPVPTCSWWSSLVWDFGNSGPSGFPLFAWPLGYRPSNQGMDLGLPSVKAISAYEYHWEFVYGAAGEMPLRIGPVGMTSPDLQVVGWGDWTVTIRWTSGSISMDATIGMGIPMAWFASTGSQLEITPATGSGLQIWRNSGNELGLRVFGKEYLFFGPTGTTWNGASPFRTSTAGPITLAVVPDTSPATLDRFRNRAAPVDSRVSWSYQDTTATLTTTYSLTVPPGGELPPLALFPHQWLHTTSITTDAYDSPRGRMKLADGGSFTTTMKFPGLVPHLPPPINDTSFSSTTLNTYLEQVADEAIPSGADTYWAGKAMGKLACLVPVARQMGRHDLANTWLTRIQASLQDWLDGQEPNLFRYDRTWSSLYGFPAGYESNGYLQDHHFHWGYFLQAAALVARENPSWVVQYGPAVEMLIRDTANWNRGDRSFPFLNSFEPYGGHAWANGPCAFHAGNNQESSSESLNFAAGVFHWGLATGKRDIRDLGIFLYTTEVEAVRRYWFNEGGYAFPAEFNWPMVGMLWGNGGAYATWFGGHPDNTEFIHGINFLPITSASLYLGLNPTHLLSNLSSFNSTNPPNWFDILACARATADPDGAATLLASNPNYVPEGGETRAHTYHWIHSLRQYGRPVGTSVTANHPSVAILDRQGRKTRLVWNPGTNTLATTFSDGTNTVTPPRSLSIHQD